ncbi:RagB/SusD family nutrient uptake outer membrane protein [Portibacter marinus]|uniref:RagB/SusD family nutrient uptake outer membrane protein n=1 Tax=Portibacter marinus TaxID=2898660 RepID=UPI001F39FCAC|nr:RagB/SusD family nutrient uptake outer membrane protein [Portibacter marinus]
MKILKNILILFLGMSVVFSCTDLETELLDSEAGADANNEFIKYTEDRALEFLQSSYNSLATFTDQNNIYALGTHTSDELIPPTRGVDWGDNGVWRTLHAHNWDATHASVLGAWNNIHQNAFATNGIIFSDVSAETDAAARFMRAFYTYHAMDMFGQVPFREVTDGPDVDPKVFSRTEAFDFIISDLETALPHLPSIGPSPTNAQASKATANYLLAKMYLNKAVYFADNPAGPYTFDNADMDRVIEHVDAITADGYSLDPDFFNVFTANESPEIIFTSPNGSGQNRWMMTLHYDQNPSGWNGFTTLADFYNKFEDQDSRIGQEAAKDGSEFGGIGKGFLIGQQFTRNGDILIDSRSQKPLQFTPEVPLAGAATEKGIRAIKYHPADHGQYILMRYADAYLMKAEALFRKGETSEALDMVNNLRSIRGASTLNSLDESILLDERGRELYWEGYRRTDQIRFGTFTDTWDHKSVTDEFRVLYPIPSIAVASNPNLEQNPGY